MIRALKVVMIVYGAILILGGLAGILIPDQMAKLAGVGEPGGYAKSVIATLGAIRLAAGVWVIIAGQDPLRHINWVKFGIMELLLLVAVSLYSISQGYVEFSQGGTLLVLAAILAVVLLALYPWRVARATPPVTAPKL
jgi:hypothetical protein